MLISPKSWKSINKLPDFEVWNQLRKGDHRALEYLYRTYGKDLFNFGMKLYGRREWVQDTLQELFIDLWKQHQKLSAVTSVKSYLFKALKYKMHRQYGKEQRWVYHIDYERLPDMEVVLPEESRMISAQLSKEKQLNLAKSIEKLPARQREVLHLLFDQGLSYEEVAGIMEINVKSVYTVAWKGISSLRKLMIDFIVVLAATSSFFF